MQVEPPPLMTAEEHDLGLAHDLKTMEAQVMARRRALVLMASAGTVGFLAACGSGSSGGSSGGTTAPTAPAAPSGSTSSTTTSTTSTTSGGSAACTVPASETAGPFPADGTNTAPAGAPTSNALVSTGVVRSDIRPSFLGSTTVATGTMVTITLTVVNANASCAPLANYAVYLWHCDRAGAYSLYDIPAQTYLRGVQVTNASGQVTFTTIVPGCYAGRFPHMHFEVFSSLTNATSGRFAVLTSQLAIPTAVCNAVYADATLYPNSASRFAGVSVASDNVFSDNSSAQMAVMTPAFTGSVAAGYTAAATIGIAV